MEAAHRGDESEWDRRLLWKHFLSRSYWLVNKREACRVAHRSLLHKIETAQQGYRANCSKRPLRSRFRQQLMLGLVEDASRPILDAVGVRFPPSAISSRWRFAALAVAER